MNHLLRVCTVVGTRPQFIKAGAVTPLLRQVADEILVDTGQHYDYEMSRVFFHQLALPTPDHSLGIGSGCHGAQTGRMLEAVEEVLIRERPNCVLVYGDTNSTLAGALAAVKLGIPVVHVEAGLRVHRLSIPEEANRVVTDHLSSLLCAPTCTAVANLGCEGLSNRTVLTGDVMVDVLRQAQANPSCKDACLGALGVHKGEYYLLTLHRPVNVDDHERLGRILHAMRAAHLPVVFPMHPRTRANIQRFGLRDLIEREPFRCCEPLGYLEMVAAESSAFKVVTDSGGVQKEAYLLGVPCVTLREETEWTETVELGWNSLVGSSRCDIVEALSYRDQPASRPPVFGDGQAGRRVVEAMRLWHGDLLEMPAARPTV